MKKERKIYYKVITKDRNSIIIGKDHPDVAVSYPVKQWAVPSLSNSKLMVFTNLEKAERFGNICSNCLVVKCHVRNPSRTNGSDLPLVPCWYSLDTIISFWGALAELRKAKRGYRSLFEKYYHAPEGSVFCDAVYCLE